MMPAVKPAEQRSLQVLVVDDNLDQVHTLAYLLRDSGHHVDFAINGIVALDLARRLRPDVILLDIGLPDVIGTTILRNLRGMQNTRNAIIIAVTGRNLDEKELKAHGFDD